MDREMYEQQTEDLSKVSLESETIPDGLSAAEAPEGDKQQGGRVSRGKLVGGLAGVGVVAAAAGGYALWRQGQQGAWPGWVASGSNGTQGTLPVSAQVGHLLRKAGFGATADEVQRYSALGYRASVDRLLNYEQVPDDEMEKRLKALNLDMNKPLDQQRWWLLRMAWTQRPLLEKMTLFWHGHFTSSYRDVGGKAFQRMIVQNQFLRDHAFDTFDNLLLGITGDPAMLSYLNLNQSRKNKPNENYARELMELFTLGVGNYTQEDVHAAALALTGWHVQKDALTARYVMLDHNTANKVFLGKSGNLDYKDVITTLTNHPAAPKFISRKLFTFFVYENPSDGDLQPLVDAYVKSNHSMKAVMEALLLSPRFFAAQAYRARMKSPVEFVVGVYRALQMAGNGANLPQQTIVMGQELFNPPNVAGWPGDKISTAWLNSGTWMTRLNYIDMHLNGGNVRAASPLDLQKIVSDNKIDTPERFVDYFTQFLLDGNIEAERRSQFIDYFKGQDSNAGQARITLSGGQSYPLNRVRGTLYLILSSPEYMLN